MRLTFFLLLAFMYGCSASTTEHHKEKVQKDEYELINLILPLVIESDSLFRARNVMLLESAATAGENTATDLRTIDSLKRLLDTAPLYVFITDSLTTYKDSQDHFLADWGGSV